jgi:hypothetical protein
LINRQFAPAAGDAGFSETPGVFMIKITGAGEFAGLGMEGHSGSTAKVMKLPAAMRAAGCFLPKAAGY